jgi:hypothetical protein
MEEKTNMKVLNAKIHGCLDYVVVLGFALAPTILGMTGLPATISYLLAFVHLSVTLVTNFPMGALKILPMKAHGMIELAVGPTLIALPWIFGFATAYIARDFYVGAGIAVFATWLITDYKSA